MCSSDLLHLGARRPLLEPRLRSTPGPASARRLEFAMLLAFSWGACGTEPPSPEPVAEEGKPAGVLAAEDLCTYETTPYGRIQVCFCDGARCRMAAAVPRASVDRAGLRTRCVTTAWRRASSVRPGPCDFRRRPPVRST